MAEKAPPGWNKTLDDLFAEVDSGLRKTVGNPEAVWARDYELSLLPDHTYFPRNGDTYEALEDVEVNYLTYWHAPMTCAGKAILKRGEAIILAGNMDEARPLRVYAKPVHYAELEAQVVPESDRMDAQYNGFSLSLKTADLNQKFKMLPQKP